MLSSLATYVKWTVDPVVYRCPTPGYSTGSASLAQNVKALGVGVQYILSALCPHQHTYTFKVLTNTLGDLISLEIETGRYFGVLPPFLQVCCLSFSKPALWCNCTICQTPLVVPLGALQLGACWVMLLTLPPGGLNPT